MLWVEMARQAHKDRELSVESRLAFLLKEILTAARKGKTELVIGAFASNDLPKADRTAKKIGRQLRRQGFKVKITLEHSTNITPMFRGYFYHIDWSKEETQNKQGQPDTKEGE